MTYEGNLMPIFTPPDCPHPTAFARFRAAGLLADLAPARTRPPRWLPLPPGEIFPTLGRRKPRPRRSSLSAERTK